LDAAQLQQDTTSEPRGDGAEAAATPPASSEGPTQRDLQRAALRDLVALATESATTEVRVEREYQAALKLAQEVFDKGRAALAQRYADLRQKTRQKYEQLRAAAAERFRAETAAARAADEPARRKVLAEFEQIGQVVQRKTEQAVWMADSVLEVSLNQLKEQEKRLNDEVSAHVAALNETERDARQRAAKYGYKPPAAPAPAAAAADAEGITEEAAATAFAARREEVARAAEAFRRMGLPNLFVGVTPWLVMIVLAGAAGVAAWFVTSTRPEGVNWVIVGAAAGGVLVVMAVLGMVLRGAAMRQVRERFTALAGAIAGARAAADAQLAAGAKVRDRERAKAQHRRETEARVASGHYTPAQANAVKKRDAAIQALDAKLKQELARVESQRAAELARAEDWLKRGTAEIERRQAQETEALKAQFAKQTEEAHARYRQGRGQLERRLKDGLAAFNDPISPARVPGVDRNGNGTGDGDGSSSANGKTQGTGADGAAPLPWEDPAWGTWKPPQRFNNSVRFGELAVDLRQIAESSPAPVDETAPPPPPPEDDDFGNDAHELDGEAEEQEEAAAPAVVGEVRLELPPPFAVPATLGFPRQASLLIQADRDGRPAAIRAVQMVMARLLTTLPAGRARFTLLDPVGLGQNFAGFMHLADHDENLVGGRIWTEQEQIEQRLTNLTAHMETVIQKYLRNEFETIDDYNAQAGELAEPYRFLVASDFPAGFTDEALRRLASIASTGARCGVYTIIFRDTRLDMPYSASTCLQDLEANGVNIVQTGPIPEGEVESAAAGAAGRFAWEDPIFRQFPLRLDPPPSEEALTQILDKVGRGAKEANRVEVSFSTIAPKPEQFWTRSAAGDVRVPIGRLGATRLQEMRLGRGMAQHVLMAGKTGSGKSTLLHALVTNLAMWYSPAEVEFYLVDFKKGVEFKTYATHRLPHARAIAVESDREFGLSVLQRLDAELSRRGEMFRRVGVQEFFSEDDKLAQDASVLLDRLVRQGRAFGIHILLGSQTIGGQSGLPRSTIGQMAVRIALQTTEADSQLILGDNNSAARLLNRPGEAIYNDQGGLVEANSPFQVAWLPDEQRERFLSAVRTKADKGIASERRPDGPPTVIFEGNSPADIRQNARLVEMLGATSVPQAVPVARAYVGEPVAIKEPTAVAFRRQSGSNLILIGQQDEAAAAILCVAMVSLAAQHPATGPGAARFYVLDATPADSPLAGTFARVREYLPHDIRLVEWRGVEDAMTEISDELQARRDGASANAGPVYVFVYGLQRYRMLRKAEEEFSFSSDPDQEKKADPGKQFADLMREGPPMGVHVLVWADTPVAVDRTLERTALREFDNRILFQMSANDSSNLIDSPAANKLGLNRALAYSEEQGVLEKFRPYALPSAEWLKEVKGQLAKRAQG
jgi:DNA segregation ATPase FtsK/SpoIIIE, S-DNA-T family